jgi:hypothetical protein
MFVEELLKLPPWIVFEGIEFRLQLFSNGPELRLAYIIDSVAEDSPHKQEFEQCGAWVNTITDPINPPLQGFLMLYEGIETDADLCYAAMSMRYWLIEKGYYKGFYHKKSNL